MEFSSLIKETRLELKESQTEFGKRFNVSHVAVSDWESNKSEAPYKVLYFCLDKSKDNNTKTYPKTKEGILILFGYPMDNSIRSEVVKDWSEYNKVVSEYKEIRYLVCAFRADGIITNSQK